MQNIIISLIKFYRWGIAPFFRSKCRFLPSCSQYAIVAIEIHGVVKGVRLTIKRLFKCHPFQSLGGREGIDEVPLKRVPSKNLD